MNINLLKSYLKNGEGITLEFKKAKSEIPKSVYETVVAFANRRGGTVLLGVNDDGKITGVEKDKVEKMKSDFTTTINNKKIEPSMYLDIDSIDIEEKTIIYINVPESSQVHRLNGYKILDRTNADGDIDITSNTFAVQQMYLRKNQFYSENRIIPFLKIEDFREDLIERVRKQLARKYIGETANEMSDFDIIKSMGMYQTDLQTREKGFTIAAVLCFGKDDIIASVLPYWRVDVLERIEDVERYDSRLDIATNLIDTYYRVMDFIDRQQSLPERFYLEGTVRTPVRNILFRELVVNMLVHREISNAFVSTIHIYKERVDIKNANKPIHAGIIKEPEINPFPKNPSIAKVFKTLGLIDELGSGINKIFKYGKIYFNNEPVIENDELFRVTFIKNDGAKVENDGAKVENDGAKVENDGTKVENDGAKKLNKKERMKKIIDLMRENDKFTYREISELIGVSESTITRDIRTLKKQNKIIYHEKKWIIKE